MSVDDPKRLSDLRSMISEKAAATCQADSQYDFGFVNGKLNVLFEVGLISSDSLYGLLAETKAAFVRSVPAFNIDGIQQSEPVLTH
jgi:hypothetical protein